jgi:hypothetical protein
LNDHPHVADFNQRNTRHLFQDLSGPETKELSGFVIGEGFESRDRSCRRGNAKFLRKDCGISSKKRGDENLFTGAVNNHLQRKSLAHRGWEMLFTCYSQHVLRE